LLFTLLLLHEKHFVSEICFIWDKLLQKFTKRAEILQINRNQQNRGKMFLLGFTQPTTQDDVHVESCWVSPNLQLLGAAARENFSQSEGFTQF
jgi:hypothetical protein